MLVKICGITSPEIAQAAVQAGADFLGFVFAKSKREVSIDQAREIISTLPDHVKSVGVFVNKDVQEIEEIAQETGLDYVQLHGEESAQVVSQFKVPVIKSLPGTEEGIKKTAQYDAASYLLMDSPPLPHAHGGNGTTFNWSILNENAFSDKLILAGGLTPENVAEAIKQVNPIGVDVSSGVETDGQKDPDKIKAFILAAKRTVERNR
ncbi:phosphoribosylanthranilate isomerase [Oceanobacillus neutriphilus]|uniref:N-(5'-phosphoribosyl)anthranilate isomerase n=1 Tax=Oceanobacillus neutriphilus TaxID=531815 RepID=A0ABQ2P0G7_9BACI|nr:phosphoribosylanthranilate isomerase [Oceanobacillus neutriphilus]GGP15010.1 N-(5'-phosphoribosyl)anthranilate isomerase [Oceanobacillus neutriphilus]